MLKVEKQQKNRNEKKLNAVNLMTAGGNYVCSIWRAMDELPKSITTVDLVFTNYSTAYLVKNHFQLHHNITKGQVTIDSPYSGIIS